MTQGVYSKRGPIGRAVSDGSRAIIHSKAGLPPGKTISRSEGFRRRLATAFVHSPTDHQPQFRKLRDNLSSDLPLRDCNCRQSPGAFYTTRSRVSSPGYREKRRRNSRGKDVG